MLCLEQPLIFTDGVYKTSSKRAPFLGHLFKTFIFYCRLISIVFRASRKAKRGRYGNKEWTESSFEVLQALEKAGVKFEITGIDNFKNLNGPCVFIGNHMSILETFVLPVIIEPFKDTTFVVKKSLIDYPVFRHVMRSREPIVVSREDPREDLKTVFEEGTKILASGRSIIVFPQKTRTTKFNPEEFNTIGVKLAKKADSLVVPIALKTDAWSNGKILKDFGKIDPNKKVYFHFGEPIAIKARGVEEHAQIIAFIQKHLEMWKE